MATDIPKPSKTRLVRLISARADLDYATEACRLLLLVEHKPIRYHLFVSMVMAYNRPFTESEGIGSLRCEYPDYPDYTDAEMNVRHQRMVDMRNKFLGHSSVHGTRAFLLAPGATDPSTGQVVGGYTYAVAKLHFLRREFILWLSPLIDALAARLSTDLRAVCTEIGGTYLPSGETIELDRRHEDFTWNIPKEV